MYRVLKTKGYSSNVVVENTETKANIIVGRLSNEILHKLLDAGIPEDTLKTASDEWNIPVSDELAKTLAGMAMRMKKPIRDQSKKNNNTAKKSTEVDAFDLIFGNV